MSSSTPTSSTPATSTEWEQLQGFTMAKYMEMHWRHRFQYLKARMELQSYLVKVRLRHFKKFHTAFQKFPHFDCHGQKDGTKNDFSPIRFSDPDYQPRLIHLRL